MVKSTVDDRVWRGIRKQIEKAASKKIKTGVFGELAIIMASQEFGTSTIPERAPIRRTFAEESRTLEDGYGRILRGLLARKITPTQAAGLMGEFTAAQIRKKITSGPHLAPPLQPATVARKGSTRPLVDTGQLVQSIVSKVE